MDPADEWMQAEMETRNNSRPATAMANHNTGRPIHDDEDDDDPFADFADDDLLRNVPCALDAAPTPSHGDGSDPPGAGPALHPLTLANTHRHGDTGTHDNRNDTLAETHQSGFFSASLVDEDWGAYDVDGADSQLASLRQDPVLSASTPTPSRSARQPQRSQPTGVFASAIPAERPSFVLCGDDGKRLWVTASGMEKGAKISDATAPTTAVSSAYLDGDDSDDNDGDDENGDGTRNGCAGGGASLLGEISVHDLLTEARVALAEDEAEKRAAQLLTEQRAERAQNPDDVLLAAALEDLEDEQDRDRARRGKRARDEQSPVAKPTTTTTSTSVEDMLWVSKYTPRNFREVLSDESINLELLRWLKSWDPYVFDSPSSKSTVVGAAAGAAATSGPPQPPEERIAILVGPPGVGKTTLAHVLAAHCGYEAIEINASVERTAARLEGTIQLAVTPSGRSRRRQQRAQDVSSEGDGAATAVHTLADHLLRPKCLIIDEMDGITSNVASFLLRQDILRPVFCVCNDFYVPSLRLMRQRCRHVFHLPPVQPQRLLARLEEVCAREHLHVDQAALAELVQSSHGDVRSCLNTLQFLKGMPEVHAGRHEGNGKSGRQSTTATVDMVRAVQGKDNKIDVWEGWSLAFIKSDRNRTLQMLKKTCGIDYEALVLASTANHQAAVALRKEREQARVLGRSSLVSSGRTTTTITTGTGTTAAAAAASARTRPNAMVPFGFRVDPGYLFANHELPRSADLPLLLDGLQENYCQRPYTDYTLRRTAATAAGFSEQDVLSTAAFVRAPMLFGFAEDFQLVTALNCYAHCSSSNRGPRVQYPRLQAQLHRHVAESEQVMLSFREGCYSVDVVSHLWSDECVSADISGLLLQCLLDASVRLPTHPINSISALPPIERKLMEASVARHAAYGLSYREGTRTDAAVRGGGGGGWDPEQRERRSEWRLIPELDLLGGVRKPFSAPTDGWQGQRSRFSRFGGPQHGSHNNNNNNSNYTGAGSANITLASPSSASKRASAPTSATLACRALSLREETKQLLQGEIHRYVVQRTAATLKTQNARHNAMARLTGGRGADTLKRARDDDVSAATGTGPGHAAATNASEPEERSARTSSHMSPATRDSTEQTAISNLHGAIREDAQAAGRAGGATAGAKGGSAGGVVKRDFFGRPIVPKATTSASPPAGSADAGGATTAAGASTGTRGTSRGKSSNPAPATGPAPVPVRYVYHDGCTNAVKMPATFADF